MPVVFEEVVASVAPEPQAGAPPGRASARPQTNPEPLVTLLRRQAERQARLRAD
jgi:hypothetical protein